MSTPQHRNLHTVKLRHEWRSSLAVLALLALLALPYLLPAVAGTASRLTGRPIDLPRLPARAMWLAVTSTAVA
ncbi:MAG: hypothetical protein ACLGHY_03365, partial [Gammaproteobacteria bacterium]